MNVKQHTKGTPKSVVTIGTLVEVWISSPTGDSSDSHILHIPCVTEAQAQTLANTWLEVWGLVKEGVNA